MSARHFQCRGIPVNPIPLGPRRQLGNLGATLFVQKRYSGHSSKWTWSPLGAVKNKVAIVLHSGRGSQFTSYEYQQFLAGHDITCSMSAVGSCYDNAAAESFFGLLKRERVNRRRYATRAEARADVFDYIELFYNPRKRCKLEQLHQTALN